MFLTCFYIISIHQLSIKNVGGEGGASDHRAVQGRAAINAYWIRHGFSSKDMPYISNEILPFYSIHKQIRTQILTQWSFCHIFLLYQITEAAGGNTIARGLALLILHSVFFPDEIKFNSGENVFTIFIIIVIFTAVRKSYFKIQCDTMIEFGLTHWLRHALWTHPRTGRWQQKAMQGWGNKVKRSLKRAVLFVKFRCHGNTNMNCQWRKWLSKYKKK